MALPLRSPSPLVMTVPFAAPGGNGSIDWPATKQAVIANLDVGAEYAALGVEFTEPEADKRGWWECRAIDREDKNPSAAVHVPSGCYTDLGGDGKALHLFQFAVKHAPERFNRWIDAARFYADRAGVEIGKVKYHKFGWLADGHFDYLDERGEVAYRVYRYIKPDGDKTFTQHPPDGKGGWKYERGAMADVAPLPYRLPELIASAELGDPVWIVEGERKADRLAAEGFTATTSHGGSKNTDKTWPAFAGRFEGRDCYVLPDNDANGRSHAAKVAALLKPVARTVKVVDLPGLKARGADVIDWLDQGGTVDDLGRLAAEAPEWEPTATAEDMGAERNGHGERGPFERVTIRQAMERKQKLTVKGTDVKSRKVRWVWPNVIPQGFVTVFAGQTGLGKSFVTCDVGARLTNGDDMPGSPSGFPGECKDVLIISEDPQEFMLAPRLREIGADMERIHFLRWDLLATYTLEDIEALDYMAREMDDLGLIMVDPPTNYLGDADEHKNAEVRAVVNGLINWLDGKEIGCALITHINKQAGKDVPAIMRVIGTVAWVTTSRIAHAFAPDPDDPNRCLFLPIKNNLGPKGKGRAYVVETTANLAKISWLGEVDITADEAMSGQKRTPRSVAAKDWLAQMFRGRREWPSDEIVRAGKEAGISRNALWEGKGLLPIKARQVITADGNRCWMWAAEEGWPEPIETVETPGR